MCCMGIIMNIDGDDYTISVNNQTVTVHKSGLKPVDEYINKLKISDICLLYTFIREGIDKQLYNDVEYFFVFSEYFKINEKTLYGALPMDIQAELLDELNSRMPVFKDEDSVEAQW